jgi:hypothetical protein
MSPTPRRDRPSAATGSRCDAQFAQASFTRRPSAPTTHRDEVESGSSGSETDTARADARTRRTTRRLRSSGVGEEEAILLYWDLEEADLDYGV